MPERVVHETERFVALVPYAGRAPFELAVCPASMPRPTRMPCPGDLVADLARLISRCFRTLAKVLGDPSVEMTLYSAPNRAAKVLAGEWATLADDYHWHIGVIPAARAPQACRGHLHQPEPSGGCRPGPPGRLGIGSTQRERLTFSISGANSDYNGRR